MIQRRFLAGFLAFVMALSFPAATAQSPTPIPRSPAPPPATAPPVITPTPSLTPAMPSPLIAPPPAYSPAPVIARDVARSEANRTYDFESDTVDGALERPEAAAAAAPPPDVPAYSDLCKASPKPPWCSDATRGNGN